MWGKVSCLRWQGLGVEPPTFRSEVQCANHYTTAPPPSKVCDQATGQSHEAAIGSFDSLL